jgi:small subunit ribosomal protein S16
MAVHIRLSRVGAKKAPLYRVVVTDQRSPREGRFIEKIGTYNPTADPGALIVNRERLDFWRGRGALPSHTLERLIKRLPPLTAVAAPAAAPPAKAPKPRAEKRP